MEQLLGILIYITGQSGPLPCRNMIIVHSTVLVMALR